MSDEDDLSTSSSVSDSESASSELTPSSSVASSDLEDSAKESASSEESGDESSGEEDVSVADAAPSAPSEAPTEPPKETKRLWERPWSMEELRASVKNDDWTLASDAGLLHSIKEMTNDSMQTTQTLYNSVEDLVHASSAAHVRVSNTFNSFLNLSYYQYIENKVYDEEPVLKENGSAEKPEPTPEEVEAIIRPQFTEAVRFALQALTLSGMRDDDVADANGANHNALDEYSKRPLPFLIGSKEFLEDDMIGLSVPEDEEEPEEPLDYVEGLPEVPAVDALPPLGGAPPPPAQSPSAVALIDPFALEDEGPGLFGAESEEEDLFKESSEEEEQPKKKRSKKEKVRTTKKAKKVDKEPEKKAEPSKDESSESEDLFAQPKESKGLFEESDEKENGGLFGGNAAEESDDDLFGGGSKKTSSNKKTSLFGDSDESEDDLFGEKTTKKKETKAAEDDDIFGTNAGKKKLDSLFGDDSEEDDLFGPPKITKNEEKKEEIKTERAKENDEPLKKKSTLFGDSDEEDDLFGLGGAKKETTLKVKEEPEPEAKKEESKKVQDKKETEKERKKREKEERRAQRQKKREERALKKGRSKDNDGKKKEKRKRRRTKGGRADEEKRAATGEESVSERIAAQGVKLFGDFSLPIATAGDDTAKPPPPPSSLFEDEDDIFEPPAQSLPTAAVVPPPLSKTLDDEDDWDDEEGEIEKSAPRRKSLAQGPRLFGDFVPPTAKNQPVKEASLWDDEEEEDVKDPEKEEETRPRAESGRPKGTQFGVALFPGLVATDSAVKAPVKKATSIFDESDEEDVVPAKKATPVKKTVADPLEVDLFADAPPPQKTVVVEDEYIFASSTKQPRAPAEDDIFAAESPKVSLNATKEEGDDLFAAPKRTPLEVEKSFSAAADEDEDIFSTKSKSKSSKSIFDDEEDDLFSDAPRKKSSAYPAVPAENDDIFEDSPPKKASSSVAPEKNEAPKDDIFSEPSATEEPTEAKSAKLVGKAKMGGKIAALAGGLKFNPAMMMPGGGPPKKEKTEKAEEELGGGMKSNTADVTEALKGRAKGPKNRRRPANLRKAGGGGGQKAAVKKTTTSSTPAAVIPPTSLPNQPKKDDLEDFFTSSTKPSSIFDDDDDDIFGNVEKKGAANYSEPSPVQTAVRQAEPKAPQTQSEAKEKQPEGKEDIFGTAEPTPELKKEASPPVAVESLFSSVPPADTKDADDLFAAPPQTTANKLADLFADADDDIFAAPKVEAKVQKSEIVKKSTPVQPPQKEEVKVSVDDIFAAVSVDALKPKTPEPVVNAAVKTSTTPKAAKKVNVTAAKKTTVVADDDDIFASASAKVAAQRARAKNEAADGDDIFAAVSTPPRVVKAAPVKKATPKATPKVSKSSSAGLQASDTDDIFATSTTKTTPVPKAKEVPSTAALKESGQEDIFSAKETSKTTTNKKQSTANKKEDDIVAQPASAETKPADEEDDIFASKATPKKHESERGSTNNGFSVVSEAASDPLSSGNHAPSATDEADIFAPNAKVLISNEKDSLGEPFINTSGTPASPSAAIMFGETTESPAKSKAVSEDDIFSTEIPAKSHVAAPVVSPPSNAEEDIFSSPSGGKSAAETSIFVDVARSSTPTPAVKVEDIFGEPVSPAATDKTTAAPSFDIFGDADVDDPFAAPAGSKKKKRREPLVSAAPDIFGSGGQEEDIFSGL